MKHLDRIVAIVFALGWIPPTVLSQTVAAKAFGTEETIYWIPAAAFTTERSDTSYVTDTPTEYVYRNGGQGGGVGYFVAPLGLEDGAFLSEIRLFLYDDDPDYGVHLLLGRYWSRLDGTDPGGHYDAISSDATPGYTTILLPVNETVRLRYDADGDGVEDEVRWVVLVGLGAGDLGNRFAGVRVAWRRQVSPAPGSATFADVPTNHAFFQYIEALADSGITAGCGNGNYCPNDPLTRGQMAVFLAKALGLHWPN